MPNKDKPVFQKHNQLKYKIILKGDETETPVVYLGKKMTFRTKFTMKEFLVRLSKDKTYEYEWVGI